MDYIHRRRSGKPVGTLLTTTVLGILLAIAGISSTSTEPAAVTAAVAAPAPASAVQVPQVTVQQGQIVQVSSGSPMKAPTAKPARLKINRGDTVTELAEQHGMSTSGFKKAYGLRGSKLIAGQTLKLVSSRNTSSDDSSRDRTTRNSDRDSSRGGRGGDDESSGSSGSREAMWDKVAKCESGGRWNINTGNGYRGGLQFLPETWRAYGGSGNPENASKAEQIRVAENVLDGQGKGAWPVCGKGLKN